MPAQWFVTGAGGFIGRALCRALLSRGERVVAMVRSGDGLDLEQAGAVVIRASLDEPGGYEPALAGCDYVVHLAGDARFGNGPGYQAANVENTSTLLAATRRSALRLKRFVFVSTIGAVDRAASDQCDRPLSEESSTHPTSDYGRSKLRAEELVRASGVPFVIVRPALVVGPDMRSNSHVAVFARSALRRRPLAWFAWPGEWSLIHVEDLVDALMVSATAESCGGRVFFAAGEPVVISDLLDWAMPGRGRVPLKAAAALLRSVPSVIPFGLKALLYPALTADDTTLRRAGWQPARTGQAIVADLIERERQRASPALPPLGRTVVTGAASGLGRALAERLASTGRRLVLIDRDEAGLAIVLTDRPAVERMVCDFSDRRALEALLASDAWLREPIDELFACAGVGLRGTVAALPAASQSDIIGVNVLARLAMAHQLLAGMRHRHFGRIVFISSSSAFQPLPFMATYAASNAAILLLGEGLAAEVREDGVSVLVVCPGGMQTGFQDRAGVKTHSRERLADPHDVAREVLEALGKDRTVIMPSMRSKGMALAARVLPRSVSLRLWLRLMRDLR